MSDLPSCWILTTPRTGSSMLCDLLCRSGLNFQEWYNYSGSYGKQPWNDRESMPKYCKVFPDQFENFYGHQRFEIVEQYLPFVKWVYLRRNDLAEQTASFLLAKRSNIWNHTSDDARQAEQLSRASIQFREDEIRDTARWLRQMDEQILRFVKCRSHLGITYESLADRRHRTLSEVLGYLGLEYRPALLGESTVKLSHPNKHELVAEIRRLLEAGGS